MCKSATTPIRDLTIEAPEDQITHNDNIYGLIAVDGSSEKIYGGQANALGYHWTDMTKVLLAIVIIGVALWFVRKRCMKMKTDEAKNHETQKIEEVSRRASEMAEKKLYYQTVVQMSRLEQMLNQQIVPMLQNQMIPLRNQPRNNGRRKMSYNQPIA